LNAGNRPKNARRVWLGLIYAAIGASAIAILIYFPIHFLKLPQYEALLTQAELEGWSHFSDTQNNDTDTDSDTTGREDSSKSPDIKELFSPRDDEYWIAGGEYWKAIQNESAMTDLYLVAFWDRSDPATFYLADALKSHSHVFPENWKLGADPEVVAVELPENSAATTTPPKSSQAVHIPSGAWGVSIPVFFDSSFRVWKALGSPHWPGVTLVDRKTRKVVRSWSARTFIDETRSVLTGPSKAASRSQLKDKSSLAAGPRQNTPLSQNVELTHTLFGKDSFVMDAVIVKNQYFLVDAVANRVLQVSRTGDLIAVFGNGSPGFADGPADSAQFRFPHRIQYIASRNALIVADWGNRAIREISLESGIVSTLLRSEKPEEMLPTELTMIGNRLLVTSAFDNRLTVIEFNAEQELTQKIVPLPRNWLKTSVLKSLSDDVAYLNDAASDKLRLLNLVNLRDTQIEAGSLRPPEHQSLRTSARKFAVLRDLALSLSDTDTIDQVSMAMRAIGSEATKSHRPRPAELATISGISSSGQQGVAWDALARRICTMAFQNPSQLEQEPGLEFTNCFRYESGPTGPAEALTETEDTKPKMIMKAGTASEVSLSFTLANDEFFSQKDLHLIRTPHNQIYAWSPSALPNFSYKAPEKAGPAYFEFSPVICKILAPERCRRIHRQVIVEIRTSYTDAHASMNQRLQL